MFFYLSKIAGFFIQPMAALPLAVFFGLLIKRTRFKRTGRLIAGAGVLGLMLVAFTPLNYWLIVPLENRFQQAELPEKIAGIIVLGGAIEIHLSDERPGVQMGDASDRMTETARLAALYPNAPIIFTGGNNAILFKGGSEAEYAKRFFTGIGIDAKRLHMEDKSRNTYENAVLSKPIADEIATRTETTKLPWILITSAFHMPRSMGIFRKTGWENILPWPTDYKSLGTADYWRISPSPHGSITRTTIAIREWIGLTSYWLTGRSEALFPAP